MPARSLEGAGHSFRGTCCLHVTHEAFGFCYLDEVIGWAGELSLMKRHLLAAVACATVMAGPALAADQALKMPVKALPSVFSWTGCYLGGNGGWIGGKSNLKLAPSGLYVAPLSANPPPNVAGGGDFAVDAAALTQSYEPRNSSYEAGVQVGCNHQAGTLVYGLEADWQSTKLSNTVDAAFPAFPNVGNPAFTDAAHTEHATSSIDWFATLRGRAGFTPVSNVFLYATLGVVFADLKSDTAVSFATFPVLPVYNGAVHVGSGSRTPFTMVVGAGAEWSIATNLSAKAEALFFQFDNGITYQSPLVAAVPAFVSGYAWATKLEMREAVVRFGLNYRVGNWGL
jgi:outer membrane immunogenic protein